MEEKDRVEELTFISARSFKPECFEMVKEIFSELSNLNLDEELIDVDWDISIVALIKDEPIGFYLIAPKNESFGKTEGRGLQGIALGLLPRYRKYGYSKDMINYTRSLGFDYIWGEHDKRLENLDSWLKIRELLGENKESYFTVENLRKKKR